MADAIASLTSPRTLLVIINSVVLAVLVTGISLVVSLPLAWLTVRTDLPVRHIWSPLLALPLVIPTYVGALVSIQLPSGRVLDARVSPIYNFAIGQPVAVQVNGLVMAYPRNGA